MKLQIALWFIVAVYVACDDQPSKVTTSVKKSITVDSRKQDKRGLLDFGYGFNNNGQGVETFTGQLVSDHALITNQVPVQQPIVYHVQVTKQVPAIIQANPYPVHIKQVAVPLVQVQQQQGLYPVLVSKRYQDPVQGQIFVKAVNPQLDFTHGAGFIGPTYDIYGRNNGN